MPNLQNFLEDSDQADLLHRGLQGLRFEIGRLCFVKEINPCRARSFRDGCQLEYFIPDNFFEENQKKICPARNELAFTVLRLYGFPSTDFSGFCVLKKGFQHG